MASAPDNQTIGELAAKLAQATALAIPPERLGSVSEALAVLLAHAASLEELQLEGVAPAFGAPRWR